jgi:hypothetical protein
MEVSWNLRELRRSNKDKKIAGICGGLGEYTPLPSWLWRAIFLALLERPNGSEVRGTTVKLRANAVRSDGGMVRGVAGGGLIGGPGRQERGLGEIRTDELEAERRAGRRSPHGQGQ